MWSLHIRNTGDIITDLLIDISIRLITSFLAGKGCGSASAFPPGFPGHAPSLAKSRRPASCRPARLQALLHRPLSHRSWQWLCSGCCITLNGDGPVFAGPSPYLVWSVPIPYTPELSCRGGRLCPPPKIIAILTYRGQTGSSAPTTMRADRVVCPYLLLILYPAPVPGRYWSAPGKRRRCAPPRPASCPRSVSLPLPGFPPPGAWPG